MVLAPYTGHARRCAFALCVAAALGALALPLGAQPVVSSLNPAKNTHSFNRTGNPEATFDRNMNAASATSSSFVVHSGFSGKRAGAYSVGASAAALKFDPTADFKPGETVDITLRTTLQDSSITGMTVPHVWRFRTAADAGPAVFDDEAHTFSDPGSSSCFGIAVADIDNDGDLDILVTHNGLQKNWIFKNDGLGNFTRGQEITYSGAAYSCAFGDFNGDGWVDLFRDGGSGCVWFNNGSGTFVQQASTFNAAGGGTRAVALADMDGDGDLDIVRPTYMYATDFDYVYFNDGSGGFSAASSVALGPGGTSTLACDVGDVDGDGDIDVIMGRQSGTSKCYLNDGTGNAYVETAISGIGCFRIRMGDIDNDGDLDVVSTGGVAVLKNNGTGTFTSAGTFGSATDASNGVELADFDGDGFLDVVVANYGGQSYVYLNDGTGAFNGVGKSRMFGGATDNAYRVRCADMDGDGDLDIVMGMNGGINTVSFNQVNPHINEDTLPTATQGVAYDHDILHDGTAPFDFQVTGGALPTGLSLNATTGKISGTPGVGTGGKAYAVEITLTDSSGNPGSGDTVVRSFTVFVAPPAAAPLATLPWFTGFETNDPSPMPTGLGANARVRIMASPVANGGSYGLQLDVTPGGTNWPLQPTPPGAGQPGADDPTRWAADATTHTGTLAWALNATGINSIDVSFDWAAQGSSSWYANLVFEIDDGTGWRVIADAADAPTNGIYRSNGGVYQTTTITAAITPTANLGLRVRWLTKFAAEDTFPCYVYVDNMAVAETGLPPPLNITTASLNAGTELAAYTQVLLQAAGGTPAYTWSINGATPLPNGLTLTGNAIQGTPAAGTAAASPYSITIDVSDSANPAQTDSVPLQLVINPAALNITTAALNSGTELAAYSQVQMQATGGTLPYTWSINGATPLPTGLVLVGDTIQGTPAAGTSAASPYTITIDLSDGSNPAQTDSVTLTLTIVAAGSPLTITTASLTDAVEGALYSMQLQVIGGTSPYTWSINALTPLPPGLMLVGDTIQGTPTAGASAASPFTITIDVSDSGIPTPQTDSVTLQLVLNGAMTATTITTTSVAAAQELASYTRALAVTGGTGPYVWTLAVGTLPSGITLSAAGVLSGTPAAGTSLLSPYVFTVQASDSFNITDTQVLSLTVQPPKKPTGLGGGGGCTISTAASGASGSGMFAIVLGLTAALTLMFLCRSHKRQYQA